MISELDNTAKLVLNNLSETKAVEVENQKVYLFLKRLFDLFGSIIGLIFLIPFILFVKISYMIKGDFKSIFYTQNRIGKNGKEFKFYKFRSMVCNADEVLKKLLDENEDLRKEYQINKKLENDPRITPVGKLIRKTSIDELPQVINILKGDMSIIGNRPYLPREKKDMGSYYDDIVKSKPGLTGFCEVPLYVENRVLNLCRGGA